MKKIFTLLMVAFCTTLFLTSCNGGNDIKLDSLSGTKWKHEFDAKNYETYQFMSSGTCVYVLHGESDGDNSLPLNWTCSSSGYVKTTVKVTGQTWKTGTFDGNKCSLVMGGTKFKLVSH